MLTTFNAEVSRTQHRAHHLARTSKAGPLVLEVSASYEGANVWMLLKGPDCVPLRQPDTDARR